MLFRMLIVILGISPALAVDETSRAWKYSVQGERLQAIGRLMNRVDDVDLPTGYGKTALMAAARQGDADLVRALLALDADSNAADLRGETPLMYAARSGGEETVRVLLGHGAEIDRRAGNGWTALMAAVAENHVRAARMLLAHGAGVNTADARGWTPLMRAAYDGHENVVKTLVRHPGIDLSRINDRGQTALHLAVIGGHAAIVRDLLAHGAPPNTRDAAGLTPYDIAQASGQDNLLAVLD